MGSAADWDCRALSGKGKGTLASVSTEDPKSVPVDVGGGNNAGRQAVVSYQTMAFAISNAIKIEINNAPASLTDLHAGDKMEVHSKAPQATTSFTARHLSVEIDNA